MNGCHCHQITRLWCSHLIQTSELTLPRRRRSLPAPPQCWCRNAAVPECLPVNVRGGLTAGYSTITLFLSYLSVCKTVKIMKTSPILPTAYLAPVLWNRIFNKIRWKINACRPTWRPACHFNIFSLKSTLRLYIWKSFHDSDILQPKCKKTVFPLLLLNPCGMPQEKTSAYNGCRRWLSLCPLNEYSFGPPRQTFLYPNSKYSYFAPCANAEN